MKKSTWTALLIGMTSLCHFLSATPAQVVIVRSAETDDSRMLSAIGLQRSGALAGYLMQNSSLLAYRIPVALFTNKPCTPYSGHTEIQTLMPYAESLKLPIRSPYCAQDVEKMAHLLLSEKRYDHNVVVLCWDYAYIADLANALGITSSLHAYPSDRHDLTWVISYLNPSGPTLSVTSQQMLFTDLSTVFNPIAP